MAPKSPEHPTIESDPAITDWPTSPVADTETGEESEYDDSNYTVSADAIPSAKFRPHSPNSPRAAEPRPESAPRTPAPSDNRPLTFEQSGRYANPGSEEMELGRGGLGRVLRVFDSHLGRNIARKELAPRRRGGGDRTPSASSIVRFVREARVTARLEHPSIIPVHELGLSADGTLYYTMKEVRGRTLQGAIRSKESLEGRLGLLNHFADLCQAMAYAHSHGVIHRDIKPANVMVGEFGETVVLDWGLAKEQGDAPEPTNPLSTSDSDPGPESTAAGATIGTPAYMSPEQAEGDLENIDQRTDVWSLGVVLYEILTGRLPFQAKTGMEMIAHVISKPVPPPREVEPDCPAELAAIAAKALQRNPLDRYTSARELADDIAAYQTGRQVRAHEYTTVELIQRLVSRHRTISAAIAVGLLALAISTVVVTRAYQETQRERDRAEVARIEAVENEYRAQESLSGAFLDKADRSLDDKAFGAAAVFAAAGLVSQPPEALPLWPFDRDASHPRRSALVSRLAEADTHRRLNHRGSVPLGVSQADPGPVAAISVAPNGRDLVYWRDKNKIGLIRPSDAGETSEAALAGETVELSTEGHYSLGSRGWTPDGTGILVPELPDGRVVLRSATDLSEVESVSFDSPAKGVCASPDGTAWATVHLDGTLRILDRSTSEVMLRIQTSAEAVHSVAYSPDGTLIATAGRDRQVRVWDAATGSMSWDRPMDHFASQMAFSGLGQMLAVARLDHRLDVVRVRDGAEVWTKELTERPMGVAFSSDDAWLAHGSQFGPMVLRRAVDGEVLDQALAGPQDNQVVAFRSFVREGLRTHELVVGGPRALRFIELIRPWRRVPILEADRPLTLFDVSQDGRWVAATPRGGKLWRTRVDSAALPVANPITTELTPNESDPYRTVSLSPDGQLAALSTFRGRIDIVDANTGALINNVARPRLEHSLGGNFFPALWLTGAEESSQLLYPDADGSIRLFDLKAEASVGRWEGHRATVTNLRASPKGGFIASASRDGSARVWRPNGETVTELQASESMLTGVAFSPDETLIATAGVEPIIRLWSVESGEWVRNFTGHRHWVNAVEISPNGLWLASASDDSTVRLWSMDTGDFLREIRTSGQAIDLAFAANSQALLIADGQSILRVAIVAEDWNSSPQALLTRAQTRSGVELSGVEIIGAR